MLSAFNAQNEIFKEYWVIAGTGTRNLQVDRSSLYRNIAKELRAKEQKRHDILVVSGGAQGFDHLLTVVSYDIDIPYVIVIPSPEYGDYYWRERGSIDKADHILVYDQMLARAEEVYYVNPSPKGKDGIFGHANFDRNQAMVEVANEFLVHESNSPGTKDAVQRIKAKGLPYVTV